MIKRLVIMAIILLAFGSTTVIWLDSTKTTTLAETVSIDQKENDFILHMRIENSDEGFRILHSLEYVGAEQVTIEHRTPLTSISINTDTSDFTGSPVSKILEPGDIYRPHKSAIIEESLEEGTHKVYMNCQFYYKEEQINIKIEKDIEFQ
ncbi:MULTISPECIES: hypothetical protein [Paraliobacillus]|uniref:hypothetical protein n=1 Tax=Paraliobacillus TaxID=200903 RepID=UPI000DD3E486|nr:MULTISPECIES: hypothetical protein [Paraliobacillus]